MSKRSFLLSTLGLALASVASFLSFKTTAAPQQSAREVEIIVDGSYQPNRITATEGERLRLKFIRRDFTPCTKEVVFEALKIRRELPTDKPVIIELPALSAGELEFKCGMSMVRGTIVVEPRS